MRTFLELGFGALWLAIAGGSTVLIVRDAISRKRGRSTTRTTSPTEHGVMVGRNVLPQNISRDDLPTGFEAAQKANRKPITFRYDQPHTMKLPHWYSK